VGCIPSKALLHTAAVMEEVKSMAQHGISFGAPKIDLDGLRQHKEGVIKQLTTGLSGMAKARQVKVLRGVGTLMDAHHLQLELTAGTGWDLTGQKEVIAFEKIIIAAGSQPVALPFLPDDPRIVDSTGAHWSLDEHRNFIRRLSPDAPAQVADPSQFAPHHQPAPHVATQYETYQPRVAQEPAQVLRRSKRVPRAPRSLPPVVTQMLDALARNKTTVAVAVLAVGLVLAAFVVRGGGSDPAVAPGSPDPAPSLVPDSGRVESVLTALTGKDPSKLTAVFTQVPTGSVAVLDHARFAGLSTLGYRVVPGEPSGDGATATQPFSVQNTDGVVIATGVVSWVQNEGPWLIASWPTLEPS
jgi:hypothetical protein